MPFIDQTETKTPGFMPQLAEPVPTPKPELRELWDAASQDISVVSASDYAGEIFDRSLAVPVEDYDPFNDIAGYEDNASSFITSYSPRETELVKRKIDEENRARETIAAGGGAGVAVALASGILDPVNLLPGGIAFDAVRGATKGTRIAKTALETGAAGLLAGGVSEGILQATQETRTAQESALNVAASTILAGALGSALGAVARRGIPGAKSVEELERSVGEDLGLRGYEGSGGSVGAAATRTTTLEQEGVKGAFGVEKLSQGRKTIPGRIVASPIARTLASPSVETRRIAGDLAEVPVYQNKNAEGIASPSSVETKVKRWHGPLAEALSAVDQNFIKYRTGKDVPNAMDRTNLQAMADTVRLGAGNVRDMVSRPDGQLTYLQFREEVGKAMRNNDEHSIPEVAAAAREARKTLIDPLKDEAIKSGLFPEDVNVDTAPSYLTRVYDAQRIIARRPEFEGRISDWLGELRDSIGARSSEMQGTVDSAKRTVESNTPRLDAAREEFAKADALEKASRKSFLPVDRELRLRDRRLRSLNAEMDRAKKRLESIKPTDKLAENDPLVEILRDIRRGAPQPESLAAFLKRSGGLVDETGELKAMDAGKQRPGLINNKSGQGLDDAARRAWDEGFFQGEARPSIDDLIAALDSDLRGNRVYREADFDAVDYADHVSGFAEELDRLGINVRKMSDEEIAQKLSAAEGNINARFMRDTASTRARAREAEFNIRRLQKKIDKEVSDLRSTQEKWDRLSTTKESAAADARAYRSAVDDLTKLVSENTRRADKVSKMLDGDRSMVDMTDAELRSIASEITDKILGGSPGRINYDMVAGVRGPLKERTLGIPDAMIEDFLVSDIEHVARVYARTMSADVEMTKKFGRPDMEDQIKQVNESYARLRKNGMTESQLQKLEKQRRDDISDLEGMRDRIRGTYGLPSDPNGMLARSSRVIRQLNFLRLMGGMTLSSISDVGRPLMIHGVGRVMGNGVAPLLKGMKAYKASAKEVKLAGTALDMVLDSRAMQLADVWDDYGRFSTFERGIQAASDRFGLVSLMAPWNGFWKQFTGVVGQTRNLQAVEAMAKGAATKKEIERLAFLGIGPDESARIAEQFAAHGKKDGGVWFANTSEWTDREAVAAFRDAIVKETDLTIVTPGQDKPLWMSTELGKVIGQFRSFTMSSMMRVTQLGLQQRDAAVLQGLVFSVSLGMLSAYLRRVAAGQDMPDDPRQWISEGVDRSGVLSWLMDANLMLEKTTRNTLGLAMLTGKPTSNRYASRNVIGSILGPSFGTVSDAIEMTGSAASGQWTAADTNKARQMIPYQNLFYIRRLFNALEDGANETLGVPPKPKR